jgi:hypothetical protein
MEHSCTRLVGVLRQRQKGIHGGRGTFQKEAASLLMVAARVRGCARCGLIVAHDVESQYRETFVIGDGDVHSKRGSEVGSMFGSSAWSSGKGYNMDMMSAQVVGSCMLVLYITCMGRRPSSRGYLTRVRPKQRSDMRSACTISP